MSYALGLAVVRRSSFTLAIAVTCLLCVPSAARADLGTVQLSQTVGRYRVTVLTTPTPLYQGTANLSVFVQDAESLAPLHGVAVKVTARREVAEGEFGPASTLAATRDTDVAGPHYLARPFFSAPGGWQIALNIEGRDDRESIAFACEVAPTPPRWQSFWPWISWPPAVILLFALREYTRSRGRAATSHASINKDEGRRT